MFPKDDGKKALRVKTEKKMTTEITKPSENNLVTQITKDQTSSFIPGLRIAQPMSEILKEENTNVKIGDYYLIDKPMGKKVNVRIGPWRFHALRLKNNSVDAEDFNLSKDSKYENGQWNTTTHSPLFAEINAQAKSKTLPKGTQAMAGFDILLYLPDFNQYCFFFLAKTALKQDVHITCMNNQQREASLWVKKIETAQFSWYVPGIDLLPITQDQFPWDEEVITKFLYPGPVTDDQSDARPR